MDFRFTSMSSYKEKIQELALGVPEKIVDINAERLKGRRPTQAMSSFLINIEQGNWAEDIVRNFTCKVLKDHEVVKYGKSDDLMAGDPEFPKFYDDYQKELDTIGKRPDLLIFKENKCALDDISGSSFEEHAKIVPLAIMGWEVRSSSYLTDEYKPSESNKRKFLSFTIKAEDIIIVLKWIQTYGVPHYYTQVFFDGVYVISFKKILEIISNESNFKKKWFLDYPTKNQKKRTVVMDIAEGRKLAVITKLPDVLGTRKKLAAGRLLHYIKLEGGEMKIDEDVLNEIMEEAKKDLEN
jgi:hypothetical protein